MFRKSKVIWFVVAICLVWATGAAGCAEDSDSNESDAELTHDAAHDSSDVAPDEDGSSGVDDATDTPEDGDTAAESDAEADSGDDAGGDDENLLFADDFSSGDMSKHNDFFRWTQGDVPAPGSGSGRVVTVDGPDGTEVQARRFRYVGVEDGGSGDAAHFSEQRFALTQSVSEERSRNAPSDVAYPEVWISYWMYVPDNYHHNLKDGTISGSNQKGWIYLWKDRYEKWQASDPDAEVTPTSASLHWWPLTEDENSDNFGMTRASLVATRGRNGWGHDGNASFIRDQEQVPNSTRNYAFLESEYGTWVHYTFGMKVASDAQSDDGFVRIYKNGELALAWENEGNGSDDPDTNGFDRGYLLGYHNAVYTKTTTYFITDFKFGLTREAVMN